MPTPFDDGFRTLVEFVPRLLIGLVNLMWGYSFTDNAVVTLLPSDTMVMQGDGDRAQRRGDAFFSISENGLSVFFHIECQSTADNDILLRFAEYDDYFARKVHFMRPDGTLVLPRPRAGLIELRPKSGDRKSTTILIQEATGENVEHEVKVITPLDFPLSVLFDRNALFLVPFFPFRYEKDLKRKNVGAERTQELLNDCHLYVQKLRTLRKEEKITDEEEEVLVETADKILQTLSSKHKDIQEVAHKMLSGQLLDIPYVRTFNKGFAKGNAEGFAIGESNGVIKASRAMGEDDAAVIANLVSILHITENEAHKRLAAFDAKNAAK